MAPSPSMWTFSRGSLRCSVAIKLLEFSFRPNGSALSGCGPHAAPLSSAGDRRSTSSPADHKMDCSRSAVLLDGARGGLYMQPNTIDEAFKPYSDTEIVFR